MHKTLLSNAWSIVRFLSGWREQCKQENIVIWIYFKVVKLYKYNINIIFMKNMWIKTKIFYVLMVETLM